MNPTTGKHEVCGLKTEEVIVTARLTGGGSATSLVNAESAQNGGGEVVSATHVSTGLFDFVFRRSFPICLCNPVFTFTGATAGLDGAWVSFDITAKTGRARFTVGSTLTDPATTDSIHMLWVARDSARNQ